MKKHLLLFVFFTFAFILTATDGGGRPAQAPGASSKLLGRRRSGLRLSNLTASQALQHVLEDFSVPGGAVSLPGCGQEQRFNFRPEGDTLLAVLLGIVKADPLYRWRISQGVVNLLPAGASPGLLNARISSFNSGAADNVSWASSMLVGLPEVQAAARNLGLLTSPNEVQVGSISGYSPSGAKVQTQAKPLQVQCRSVTVREALNAIVRANRGGVWVYEEQHCRGESSFRIIISGAR